MSPWWPNFKNDKIVSGGYSQGPIMPSFVRKFQKLRQLFPEQPELRLPLVEATRKKGRPSLRSGLNNFNLVIIEPIDITLM
jgi:hypothetical protein